jgi:hypothetical protein
MIEGEFHSVWLSPEGDLIDVTPHDGETEIVFVRDKVRRYKGKDIRNTRRALRSDPRTMALMQVASEQDDMRDHPPPGVIFVEKPLYRAALRRSDPCPCRSGKAYRACCRLLGDREP